MYFKKQRFILLFTLAMYSSTVFNYNTATIQYNNIFCIETSFVNLCVIGTIELISIVYILIVIRLTRSIIHGNFNRSEFNAIFTG